MTLSGIKKARIPPIFLSLSCSLTSSSLCGRGGGDSPSYMIHVCEARPCLLGYGNLAPFLTRETFDIENNSSKGPKCCAARKYRHAAVNAS